MTTVFLLLLKTRSHSSIKINLISKQPKSARFVFLFIITIVGIGLLFNNSSQVYAQTLIDATALSIINITTNATDYSKSTVPTYAKFEITFQIFRKIAFIQNWIVYSEFINSFRFFVKTWTWNYWTL